jgi:hypothetical protein
MPQKNKNTVTLQQDSGRNCAKLTVEIPAAFAESEIKIAMRYRNTGKYATYLQRLKAEGTHAYDSCIERLHSRFGRQV